MFSLLQINLRTSANTKRKYLVSDEKMGLCLYIALWRGATTGYFSEPNVKYTFILKYSKGLINGLLNKVLTSSSYFFIFQTIRAYLSLVVGRPQ